MKKWMMWTSLVLVAAGARAQQGNGLRLEEAQSIALQNNPQLQGLVAETDAAGWEKWQALSAHIPHVTLEGNHVFDAKYPEEKIDFGGAILNFPGVTPTDTLSARATWMIFDGFNSINKYRAASANEDARKLELDRAKLRLNAEIRTRFYTAIGAQYLVDVANESIETLSHHSSDVNAQVRGGVSTRFDLLRIDVQLEEARSQKMEAMDLQARTREELFQALGAKDDGRKLAGVLPEHWSQLNFDRMQLNINNRQDRQAGILDEEAATKMHYAAMGHWAPEISLYGQEDWYKFNDYEIVRSNDGTAYSVGVMLRWNLFDGGGDYAAQKVAADRQMQATQKLRALNDQIPVEFDTWKRKLKTSVAIYQAKLTAIKEAEEAVRLAKNGVRAGVRTNTEVLDAELDLNQAKAKAVRAQIDSVEALGQLELALGQSLADQVR